MRNEDLKKEKKKKNVPLSERSPSIIWGQGSGSIVGEDLEWKYVISAERIRWHYTTVVYFAHLQGHPRLQPSRISLPVFLPKLFLGSAEMIHARGMEHMAGALYTLHYTYCTTVSYLSLGTRPRQFRPQRVGPVLEKGPPTNVARQRNQPALGLVCSMRSRDKKLLIVRRG